MAEKQTIEKLQARIKELEKNEVYYNLIIQKSNQSIILIQDGKVKFANNFTLDITGYSLKEIRSTLFLDFIHPEDKEMVLKNYTARMAGLEAPREYEFRIFTKNKNILWVRTEVSIIFWKKKPAIINFITDITENKLLFTTKEQSESQLIKYKEFFDYFPETLFEADLQGTLTFVNKRGFDMFGYDSSEIVERKKITDMLVPEEFEKAVGIYKKRLEGLLPATGIEYLGITKQKKQFPIIVYSDRIFENGKVVGLRGVIFDITEQKKKEQQFKLQTDCLSLINSLNSVMADDTSIDKLIDRLHVGTKDIFNLPWGIRLYLYNEEDNQLNEIGSSIKNVKEPIEANILLAKKILNQHKVHVFDKPAEIQSYIKEFDSVNNHQLVKSIIAVPLVSKDKKVGIMDQFCDRLLTNEEIYSFQTIAYQVTTILQRRITEIELAEREKNYKYLIDNLPVGIVIHDAKTIHFANKTAFKIFNIDSITVKKLKQIDFLSMFPSDKVDRVKERVMLAAQGKDVPFTELEVINPFNNSIIEVESTVTMVNYHGKKMFQSIFRDLSIEKKYQTETIRRQVIEESNFRLQAEIDERKSIEKQLKTSLQEKEILFKEVHHRVKNNMQVISSILSLQSRGVDQKNIKLLFEETQDRIKSMALIHESLYRSQNLSKIDLKDYIKTLTSSIYRTYNTNISHIKLELELDDVFVNLDTGIPCGLIINEIISNSLKYAFENTNNCCIFVKLKDEKDKNVSIIIGDNGKGITKDISIENAETLGLQIIYTLTEQINGEIQAESELNKGTKYTIKFKTI